MRENRLVLILLTLIAVVLITVSCQKEFLCNGCDETNISPVARTGKDTIIVLPADSAILRGVESTDPDGTIQSYNWSQLSGPDKSTMKDSTLVLTRVSRLKKGIYTFKLTVTDNGGKSATDTMEVKVTDINLPPVANAGVDRTVFLPKDTLLLDGSGSTDPENNIKTYKWRKLSGAPITYIYFTDRMITNAYSVIEDNYQFELTVTDAGGLSSVDTISIKVMPPDAIIATLQDVGKQIKPRYYPTGISIGDKVIFAGGFEETGYSSRVDILDTKTNTLTTAELSVPRMHIGAVVANDKVYFAGGVTANEVVTSRIDIYDVKKNVWTTDELSEGRFFIAAAKAGNKLIFAGGSGNASTGACSRNIDIFDIPSNSWSTAKLSEAGFALTAATAGSNAYFAGGDFDCRRKSIDIFDASTNTWSKIPLGDPRAYLSSTYFDDNVYWAGGVQSNQQPSATVEILNIVSNNVSFATLTSPVAGFKSKALIHFNDILFFSGDGVNKIHFNKFEIGSGLSTEGRLNKHVLAADFVSLKNKIYMAGGSVDGFLSDRIWIVDL